MTEKTQRGFAGMDSAKQREIARKGGRAAHQKGTAHKFTPEEAAEAGRKGGRAAHVKGTAHKFTPEEAAAAGRKGGQAAHSRALAKKQASAPMQEAAARRENQSAHPGLYPEGRGQEEARGHTDISPELEAQRGETEPPRQETGA